MRPFIAVIMMLFWAVSAAQVPTAALRYRADLIRSSRSVWGIDAPVATFAGQIHQESQWKANARSPVGAQGLTQFMPSTSAWISKQYPELSANQPFNPAWSMQALVRYDRWLWQRIDAANNCERMAMTLSAYNGGLGWVYKDQKVTANRGADPKVWFGSVERFNAGRTPEALRENRGYPRIILKTNEPVYQRANWGSGSCTTQESHNG